MAARSSTVANSTTTTSMLRRLLPHERGNPPLQLGQLDRLHEHAAARHLRQPAPREMRDVARQKHHPLGERRPLLLEMLVKLGAVHLRHPQVREHDVTLRPFGPTLERSHPIT